MIHKTAVDALISTNATPGNHRWAFGNSVLYDMCRTYPLHNDPDIVVGKIWLIGRSYAAAVERRKTGDGIDNDDFYYDVVAPAILEIGGELDARITAINAHPNICEETIDEVLQLHKFLMDRLLEITELEKRSLTSKYLHFHCPNMVYIYDSRACIRARQLVSKDGTRFSKHKSKDVDAEYTDFCVRILELQEYIAQQTGRIFPPRDLDNLLLNS